MNAAEEPPPEGLLADEVVVALRSRLQRVYWIGGGSGAGKSTIARRIASRHGFAVYATDDVMPQHARRLPPLDAPWLSKFMAMDMNERWMQRSPRVMLDTFHWFRGEGFGSIVEDLLTLPPETGVIAEGFRLLPRLVAPLLLERSHSVWLLPTPSFRLAAFESRGSMWEIPNQTSDPPRALRNLLERDRMFTDHLAAEATRLHLPAVEILLGMGEDQLTEKVTGLFGL